jgi:hypothetical protein
MSEVGTEPTAKQHAAENDALRAFLPGTAPGNRVVATRGVAALGAGTFLRIVLAVRDFDTFTEDNDPYGEHDFGSFMLDGQKFFWKIDFYNGMEGIRRLLTIMRADEY